MPARRIFAAKLRSRTPMIGTFVKLGDPSVIEILGVSGCDFVIVDAEHAPFDRAGISLAMLAARAANIPALVRVPEPDGHWISTALDCGAAGIMVPQVQGPAMAAELVARTRYSTGSRGFSPSTAGAGYGTRGVAGHLESQADETVLICQIEDRRATELAAEIAEVDGVDGLLVGPVDLAVSEGLTDPLAAEVLAMGTAVMNAASDAGISGGMFVANTDAASLWSRCGATLFVLGADQSFLMQGAKAGIAAARQAAKAAHTADA